MDSRLSAPATQRNREPILAVLARVLPARGAVLEIASGTGEHAVFLAAQLPAVVFQPSDPDPAHRASIAAWIAEAGVQNLRAPLAVDVTDAGWEARAGLPSELAAILCINMIHIAPWRAALGLLRGAAAALSAGRVLYLYGPFRRGGQPTAASNERFDLSLRAQNPEWGLRNLEDFSAAADGQGFTLEEIVEMPANNLSVILRRRADACHPALPAAQGQATGRSASRMLGASETSMVLPPKHCPECGEEYVHSVSVCAHCGVALVLSGTPIAARELPPAASLRRIRTATLSWGRGFSARLVAAGIAHRVELEPDSDDGAASNRSARLCGVFVRDEDVAEAMLLDREHLRSEIPDLPEDLDLAAQGEDLCPACGEPADLAAAECASCGLAFRDAE